MSRRTERVNELLRQEISDLLLREVRDPRVSGLVTITSVDVSPDLRQAKVYVSVMGSEGEQDSTMRAMEAGARFLQHQLRKRLTIRRTPELRFFKDDSIEKASRMLALLDEAREDRSE